MDESTKVNHTHDTSIDTVSVSAKLKNLRDEKLELQKKYDYYKNMGDFYRGSLEDILTTIKHQIDRIDSKIQNTKA